VNHQEDVADVECGSTEYWKARSRQHEERLKELRKKCTCGAVNRPRPTLSDVMNVLDDLRAGLEALNAIATRAAGSPA
jgi:hypothetical protein